MGKGTSVYLVRKRAEQEKLRAELKERGPVSRRSRSAARVVYVDRLGYAVPEETGTWTFGPDFRDKRCTEGTGDTLISTLERAGHSLSRPPGGRPGSRPRRVLVTSAGGRVPRGA